MKYLIPIVSASIWVNAFAAEQSNQNQDYVVQADPTNPDEVFSLVSVSGPDGVGSEDGTFISEPIFSNGAHFELWGIGLGDDTNHYLLDEQITSAHIPTGTVKVSSKDPYEAITRTRADQPFTAQFTVADISSDEDAPLSSKYLYFERLVGEFPEGSERSAIDDPNGEEALRVVESFFINGNGSSGEVEIETSLDMQTDDDGNAVLNTQKGEERIRLYALPNENLSWFVLAEEKVYVWPLATAEMTISETGSKNDARSLDTEEIEVLTKAPTIYVSTEDLYPSSTSYLRIYEGEKVDEPTSAEQVGSTLTAEDYEISAYNTATPQELSSIVSAASIAPHVEAGKTYTIELVTTTPFAENETVTWITFAISSGDGDDGVLNININNITTSE